MYNATDAMLGRGREIIVYDTRACNTSPGAMKRVGKGRRVEIKGSRDPEAATKTSPFIGRQPQTCVYFGLMAMRKCSGPSW